MIDYVNEHRSAHVITIEDPIEYVHEHKRCMINQREVGADVDSFAGALRAALWAADKKPGIYNMRDVLGL